MTNKFNLEEQAEDKEQAVRSSADRISRETRRMRREFNGTTQHFALDPRVVEELSKEGHLCWCNDDLKGHLSYLEGIGYRFVLNREVAIDRDGIDPEGRVTVRYGVADKDNTPQDVYLMIQPWVFWKEDQAEMQKEVSKMDQEIKDSGKDVERSYDRRVEMEYKR